MSTPKTPEATLLAVVLGLITLALLALLQRSLRTNMHLPINACGKACRLRWTC